MDTGPGSARGRFLIVAAALFSAALLFLLVHHLPARHALRPRPTGTFLPYQGRFLEDPAYHRFSGALRRFLAESARRVESELDLSFEISRFRLRLIDDSSPFAKTGRFVSRTVQGSSGSPLVIELRLEPILSGRADPLTLLTHEVTHAALAAAMGSGYRDLPVWLREGMAVHVAGEAEVKLDRAISTTSLRPVTRIADGLSGDRHSTRDYAEDALAIGTLGSLAGEDALRRLSRCLVGGESWTRCLRELTGLAPEEFEARALTDARERIAKRAGELPERYDHALSLLDGGDPSGALEEFGGLLCEGGRPFHLEALFQSARALTALGRPDEARGRIGELFQVGGYGPRLAVRARLLEMEASTQAGDPEGAERICVNLLRYYAREGRHDLHVCRPGA